MTSTQRLHFSPATLSLRRLEGSQENRWGGPYVTFWNPSRDLGWEWPCREWKPRHWECTPTRIPPGIWTSWTIHDLPDDGITVSVRFATGVWSDCCEGTGFADYAAVPCPNPQCPIVPKLVQTQRDAEGDSDGDDDGRQEDASGNSENGIQHA